MKRSKIDKKTAKQIERGVDNVKSGNVSGPINKDLKKEQKVNQACEANRCKCNKLSKEKREELSKRAKEIVDFENSTQPQIKNVEIIDQPDGSALMNYEVNPAFIKSYMLDTGAKEFTVEGLNAWVLKHLAKQVKELNDEKFPKKT